MEAGEDPWWLRDLVSAEDTLAGRCRNEATLRKFTIRRCVSTSDSSDDTESSNKAVMNVLS